MHMWKALESPLISCKVDLRETNIGKFGIRFGNRPESHVCKNCWGSFYEKEIIYWLLLHALILTVEGYGVDK